MKLTPVATLAAGWDSRQKNKNICGHTVLETHSAYFIVAIGYEGYNGGAVPTQNSSIRTPN